LYWIIIYSRRDWADYEGENGIGGYTGEYLKVRPDGKGKLTDKNGN